MGSVYLIGSAKGPCHIGIGDKPQDKMAERLVEKPNEDVRLIGQWPLREPSGLAFIVKVVRGWFGGDDADWLQRPAADCSAAIQEAYDLVMGDRQGPLPGYSDFGKALQTIRTERFGVTQNVMARIMKTSNSTYLRWESGQNTPAVEDWSRLTHFAKRTGIPLGDDELFKLAAAEAEKAHTATNQERHNGRKARQENRSTGAGRTNAR